ncbi:hypothetical protein N2152v2_005086 [Parachlorella kessleri]
MSVNMVDYVKVAYKLQLKLKGVAGRIQKVSANAPAPPPEGLQRRQLHFESVAAQQLQGSLWQSETLHRDPSQLINLAALDALFAQPVAPSPGGARKGAAAGLAGSEGGWVGTTWFPRLETQGSTASLAAAADATLAASGSGSVHGGNAALLRQASSGVLGGVGGSKRAQAVRFIVGGRKAVNIEILLKKLGRPPQVAAAIAELDSRRLPGAIVRELQSNMPEESELDALHAYLDCGGEVADLGPAEQVFAALKEVPRLDQKLQVIIFKGCMSEAAAEVTKPLADILAALEQVQKSPQLRLLLHTVLQLGNTLNAGRRPPSSGIRLSSLRKLADTRSFDGSTTLVHYLVALLSQSAPELLLLGKPGSQLSAVHGAAKHTFSELDAALATLRRGLGAIEQELRAEEHAAVITSRQRGQSSRATETEQEPGLSLSDHAGSMSVALASSTSPGTETGTGACGMSHGSGVVYLEHLRELQAKAAALLGHAEEMLAASRSSAAMALGYLGEGRVQAETVAGREALAREPRRMLGDLDEFLQILQRAHADALRMSVCLASLQGQQGGAAGGQQVESMQQ